MDAMIQKSKIGKHDRGRAHKREKYEKREIFKCRKQDKQ